MSREMEIDLGLTLSVRVPDEMSDADVIDALYRTASGEGDSRNGGGSLMSAVNWYVQARIQENLNNLGMPIQVNGSGIQIKPKGDLRTPRERSFAYEAKPEFTGKPVR